MGTDAGRQLIGSGKLCTLVSSSFNSNTKVICAYSTNKAISTKTGVSTIGQGYCYST